MVKKIITGIIDAVSVVLIVFAIGILLTVIMTRKGEAPDFLGYSSFRVLTGSMEPAIPPDAMVVTRRADPGEISEGDIISYYSPDPELGGSVVTHRVTGVESDGGSVWYRTKGDANAVEDEYPVSHEAVIGKLVFTSAVFGKAVRLAANPLVFVLLILVPLMTILVVNLVQAVRSAREIASEEGAADGCAGNTADQSEEERLRAEIDRIEAEIREKELKPENQDSKYQDGKYQDSKDKDSRDKGDNSTFNP